MQTVFAARIRLALSAVAATVALLTLAGCEAAQPSSAAEPAARIVLRPPPVEQLAGLQQSVSSGHQPWRADAYQVARVEFLSLVNRPPADLEAKSLKALKEIDRPTTEKKSAYRMYHDAEDRTHVVFDAPPFVADVALTPERPREGLPAIWVTRTVTLRRLKYSAGD